MILKENVTALNSQLKTLQPAEIIAFVLQNTHKPILTTSFGKYAASLLHAVRQFNQKVPVLWCDTGYNTDATYRFMQELITSLNLQVEICTPEYTTAYINSSYGPPEFDNPNYDRICTIAKIAPFKAALNLLNPGVWFTNLRKDQNLYRESLDILSFSKDGILKVAPFFYWDESAILDYLAKHDLPVNVDYFDPIKANTQRECGIHFA